MPEATPMASGVHDNEPRETHGRGGGEEGVQKWRLRGRGAGNWQRQKDGPGDDQAAEHVGEHDGRVPCGPAFGQARQRYSLPRPGAPRRRVVVHSQSVTGGLAPRGARRLLGRRYGLLAGRPVTHRRVPVHMQPVAKRLLGRPQRLRIFSAPPGRFTRQSSRVAVMIGAATCAGEIIASPDLRCSTSTTRTSSSGPSSARLAWSGTSRLTVPRPVAARPMRLRPEYSAGLSTSHTTSASECHAVVAAFCTDWVSRRSVVWVPLARQRQCS